MTPQDQIVTVWDRFRQVAEAQPEHVALVEGSVQLTYSQLGQEVEALAARLVAQAGPGHHHIGIRARSAQTALTSSLAVARAGMVSVCLDIRDPEARLAAVCQDAAIKLVLTDVGGTPSDIDVLDPTAGPSTGPGLSWQADVGSEDLSCITYSSGSTGAPKGIMWSHRTRLGLADRLAARMTADERFGLPFAGTAGNTDAFSVIALTGRTLVAYPIGENGLNGLAEWARANDVNAMGMVPTLVRHFLATLAPGEVLPLRRAFMYGEGPQWSDVAGLMSHLPPGAVVENAYGTMETAGGTDFSVGATTPMGEGRVPAGWPCESRQVDVLGPDGAVLAPGQTGEIFVAGSDLPSGYWGKPELSEQKWRQLPDGRRQYRTGDLGLKTADGCLLVLGRNDHMVKVNGFKVELSAIEERLLSVPGVRSAAAVPRQDDNGNVRVVAWAVASANHSEGSLRADLCRLLPGPMVPDRVVLIDEMPSLSNGKADRQDLGRREIPGRAPSGASSALAQRVAGLFDQVLNIKGTGPDDDFFELGGDSLRAARLVAEMEKAFGTFTGVAIVLEARTPAALAERLAARAGTDQSTGLPTTSQLVPLRVTGDRPPLIVVHDGTGGVMYARGLADLLGDRQPVYAIEGPQTGGHKATDRTVEAMASRYVGDLRRAVPEGPCVIFGHSFGGLLALEMAHQLQVLGQEVILLAIGDTPVAQFSGWSPLPLGPRLVQMAKKVPNYGPRAAGRRALDVSRGFAGRKKAERARKEAARYLSTGETAPLSIRNEFAMADNGQVAAGYEPQPYNGDVLLFTAAQDQWAQPEGWERLVNGQLVTVPIDAIHTEMMGSAHIGQIAAALEPYLAGTATAPTSPAGRARS